jgi:hypothetical protein
MHSVKTSRDEAIARLEGLLHKMNIPMWRKRSTSTDNFRWLHRNLAVRNSEHKNYAEAIKILEDLV